MQVTTKNPPTKERKKRSRATDEEGKAEDSTDDATSTTCSSDEEPLGTISTLLTAAARIEKTKAASLKASNKKTKKVAVAEKTEESSTPVGLSTLLEVASTIGVKGQNGDGGASLPAPGSKVENEPPLGNGEAREGDELFYPSAEELEEASTRRSRSALFSWYDRLRDLYAYKEEHGDCMVPQKYPTNHALGIWVNKQRMEKRLKDQGLKCTMTDHRLALLDKVGFHWAKHKGQVSWDQKYEELRDFHRQNGHCNVPTKYRENSALGRWISTQRAQLKEWRRGEKTSMTQVRYAKLCALDFQFERLASKKRGDGSKSGDENDDDEQPGVAMADEVKVGRTVAVEALPPAMQKLIA